MHSAAPPSSSSSSWIVFPCTITLLEVKAFDVLLTSLGGSHEPFGAESVKRAMQLSATSVSFRLHCDDFYQSIEVSDVTAALASQTCLIIVMPSLYVCCVVCVGSGAAQWFDRPTSAVLGDSFAERGLADHIRHSEERRGSSSRQSDGQVSAERFYDYLVRGTERGTSHTPHLSLHL